MYVHMYYVHTCMYVICMPHVYVYMTCTSVHVIHYYDITVATYYFLKKLVKMLPFIFWTQLMILTNAQRIEEWKFLQHPFQVG